jgi:hypothetical protein
MRLTAVLLVALGSGAVAAPRAGKVVRIERKTAAHLSNPRLCEIEPNGNGNCLGDVHVGDVVVVISADAVIGEVRLDETSVARPSCPLLRRVHGTFLGRSQLPNGPAIGVIDGNVDKQRARMMINPTTATSPNGHDQVFIAVDGDGDGTPDIMMTQSMCDAAGNTVASGGACLDVWAGTGSSARRVQHANMSGCN